jgi:hypothetical protein
MLRPLLLALLLCLTGSFAVAGCNSVPTLPLPPPVASVSGGSEQGLVRVEGQVNPLAYVSVFNERAESGVITRADTQGFFSAELEGRVGDLLTIWQEVDGNTGERKQTTVPELD